MMGHPFKKPGITKGVKPDEQPPQKQRRARLKQIWERPVDWPEPEKADQIEPSGPNTMKPNWFTREQ